MAEVQNTAALRYWRFLSRSLATLIAGIVASIKTDWPRIFCKCRSVFTVVSIWSFPTTKTMGKIHDPRNAETKRSLRLGLNGLSGIRAASKTVKFSPPCLRSKSAAISAEYFLVRRERYCSLAIS